MIAGSKSSRPRDTRREILDKARELFVAWGYRGLSMRQVAEAVAVTKAALYYHFQDKESLFLAVLGEYLDEVEPLIIQAEAEGATCRQRICLLVHRLLDQPAEKLGLIRLASQEVVHLQDSDRQAVTFGYHERFLGRIQAILAEGMADGELRAADPGLAAWVLLGMIYPYLNPARSGRIGLPDEAVEQMLAIYLDGLATRR